MTLKEITQKIEELKEEYAEVKERLIEASIEASNNKERYKEWQELATRHLTLKYSIMFLGCKAVQMRKQAQQAQQRA